MFGWDRSDIIWISCPLTVSENWHHDSSAKRPLMSDCSTGQKYWPHVSKWDMSQILKSAHQINLVSDSLCCSYHIDICPTIHFTISLFFVFKVIWQYIKRGHDIMIDSCDSRSKTSTRHLDGLRAVILLPNSIVHTQIKFIKQDFYFCTSFIFSQWSCPMSKVVDNHKMI